MSALRWGHRTILGINFFQGSTDDAVRAMRSGGLLVVPAAPALKDIDTHPGYREALLHADVALTDSSFMVIVWNMLQRDSVKRISGLEYLRRLLLDAEVRRSGSTLWIMPDTFSANRHVQWLEEQGIHVPESHVYIAPLYGKDLCDLALVQMIERLRPQHIIVSLGGGTQERLGYYLKRNLGYRPAIHCIGAALAFLSGAQVKIPVWADHLYLGWLFRSLSDPGRFIPRYWSARKLLSLMRRYRERLPVSLV